MDGDGVMSLYKLENNRLVSAECVRTKETFVDAKSAPLRKEPVAGWTYYPDEVTAAKALIPADVLAAAEAIRPPLSIYIARILAMREEAIKEAENVDISELR